MGSTGIRNVWSGRIGVRAKVAAIAALGVAAIVAANVLAVLSIEGLKAAQQRTDAFDRVADLNHQIALHFLEARRSEKDFLARKDEKYVALVERHASAAQDFIASLAGMPEVEAVRSDLETMAQGGARHLAQFKAVVEASKSLGLNEDAGLLGRLRDSVHKAEDAIAKSGAAGLRAEMLMLRRHEKDYQLRGDPQYLEKLKKQRETFRAALERADIGPDARGAIGSLIDDYFRDVAAYIEADLKLRSQIRELSAIYAAIEPAFERVRLSAETGKEEAVMQAAVTGETISQVAAGISTSSLMIIIVLAWLIGRGITRPIRDITQTMERLADGNGSIEVPYTGNTNEVGAMARAVLVFQENGRQRARLEAEREEAATRRQARAQALEDLVGKFETSVGTLVASVADDTGRMNASAQEMATTAQQTERKSVAVTSSIQEANAAVENVASAAEELSASIREIARQVSQSSSVADQAVEEAHRTDAVIRDLAEAAQRIGEVVNLINDIASQTNLLALNATIEAARAGEAGKGFAVVASEVKNLATQTARATEEIAQQIAAIQSVTKDAVGAIEGIGGRITEINGISAAVASAVEEQGAATEEIARNIEQVLHRTQSVSFDLVDVGKAAGTTGTSARDLLSVAGGLARQFERLKGEVDNFVGGVRVL